MTLKQLLPTCIALLTLYHVGASNVFFYVSPTGVDSHNDGRNVSTPLRSIHTALTLASRWNKNDTKIIELMAGYYELSSNGATIGLRNAVIRSYKNQEVHLTGGQRVTSSAFKHVTDQNILSKLTPEARKHVRVVHLPDVNITDYGNMSLFGASSHRRAGLEVSFNGEAMKLARWPNKGYIDITSTPDGEKGNRFTYNSTVPKSWLHESDPWIHGFLKYAWFDEALPVRDLNTHTMTVTLGHHPARGIRSSGHWMDPHNKAASLAGFFKFINILSALDEAGEYYLDKANGNLYIWVPNNDGNVRSTDVIQASEIDQCITFQSSAKNVTLQDFVVESCRRYGISGGNLRDVHLINLEIKNTGSAAVHLNGDNRNVRIAQCLIHDCDRGIDLNGGNRKLLEASGNVIEDNEIYKFSRASIDAMAGIYVRGVGMLIRNNYIHSSNSRAIVYVGNEIVMEHNLIHDVCMDRYMCTGIRSHRDETERGNVIRSNIIHDIRGLDIPNTDCQAIYLDIYSSGNKIINNVLYNHQISNLSREQTSATPTNSTGTTSEVVCSVFQNDIHLAIFGGRDNIITDNVMYNATKYSVVASQRNDNVREHQDFLNYLHNMPYHSPDWELRYPELASIDTTNYTMPEDNKIDRNVVYIEGKAEYVHSNVNNPKFFNITNIGYSIGPNDHYDVRHGDYRVKCSTAEWANKNNFQQVPSPNDVGPRKQPIGPKFLHHGRLQIQHLAPSSSICTTKAPATKPPVSSYLPDGSDTHHIFNVSNEGCWLVVTKCTKNSGHTGTFRDMYGERFQHAGESEKKCFNRAVAEWRACGGLAEETVAAIYGPTGATTYAGDGCFIAQYGCPLHGGPSDGHAIRTGKIVRDVVAETNHSGKTSESGCLSHALEYWKYCGSSPNHPVTSIYRPTGATRMAGAGCWIHTDKCPSHPEYKSMFYDAWGSTNRHTDAIQQACLGQAEYYWHLCGSDTKAPVTAYYRPTTASKTFP